MECTGRSRTSRQVADDRECSRCRRDTSSRSIPCTNSTRRVRRAAKSVDVAGGLDRSRGTLTFHSPLAVQPCSRVHVLPSEETDTNVEQTERGDNRHLRTLLTHVASVLLLECVREPESTLHFCAIARSDVISSGFFFTARPLRAIVEGSPDLPRTGRPLHRRSRKAGPVPRPQFILFIEPDDDTRVMYAECQHTFGFTVLIADATNDGLTHAADADVIVTWIRVPGSRTPKCDKIYRRVMVL